MKSSIKLSHRCSGVGRCIISCTAHVSLTGFTSSTIPRQRFVRLSVRTIQSPQLHKIEQLQSLSDAYALRYNNYIVNGTCMNYYDTNHLFHKVNKPSKLSIWVIFVDKLINKQTNKLTNNWLLNPEVHRHALGNDLYQTVAYAQTLILKWTSPTH